MATTFDIEPRISTDVYFGNNKRSSVIFAGKLAERGTISNVYFDGSDNFVVLEVGKRGSGKSYGMGSLLEGFATSHGSAISNHSVRRAVLLLDPLDIHWTATIPLSDDGPEALKTQYSILTSWGGLSVEPINTMIWMPAGFGMNTDHPALNEYYLPVSALDADDWSILLQTDLILEPRGRLIYEAYNKVTLRGWEGNGRRITPRSDYSIQDIIDCINLDSDIIEFYSPETIRSVVQPLMSYARMPLFSEREGTSITNLIREGYLSVLSLGRLESDLRTVLTTVVIRKLRKDRMVASQINRRLALQSLDDATRATLLGELINHVPRTILAIDEAQILLPQRISSSARKEIEAYVLEGRNYGLSLWLATQRPKGAISDAAISQIDTFIVHRLSVTDDINAVCNLLQNAKPEKIKKAGIHIDISDLIRSLDVGQALISSAVSNINRFIVVNIRPRMVAHGGEAF
jgi:DNA helicase HerA-like ATPase